MVPPETSRNDAAGHAIVEIRGLPAQAVAAVEIAEQLMQREYGVSFVSGKVPEWFTEMYPDLAATVTVLREHRIDKSRLWRTIPAVFGASVAMVGRRAVNKKAPRQFRLCRTEVADLIVDSSIRSGGAQASWLTHWALILRHSIIAAQILQEIDSIVKRAGASMIVTSSRSYASVHGLLARYGHESRLEVLNNAPTFLAFTRRDPNQFRYRDEARADVVQFIEFARKDVSTQSRLRQFKDERFSHDSPNKDYRRAVEKTTQGSGSTTDLASILEAKGPRRVIYLAPHVFADAVHMEGPQLFRDYLRWFAATIMHIQDAPDAIWLTKAHPAASDYGEQHLIGEILEKYNWAGRVLQLDERTSPAEILAVADAVVTVRGTVGMEFGVHGKPVVLAGSARYSHLGYTVSPRTRRQYFAVLTSLSIVPPLRVDAFAALASLYFFENQLIAANLPGSAFAQKALNLGTADWRAAAGALETVRQTRADPYLARVSQVLDKGRASVIFE